jgi:type I restriction enzyme S subunit
MSKLQEYRIGEIAEVIGGGTPDTKDDSLWNGDIAWITPADLSRNKEKYFKVGERSITQKGLKESSTRLLPKGTVLLSSRAPIGYLAIAANSICTNQGFKSLICNEDIVSYEYLYYYLLLQRDYLETISSGATFPELSGGTLKKLKIQLPTLPKQQRVALIIKTYDDLIEVNNERIKLLEVTARELYKEWFVRMRFPDYKKAKFEKGIPKTWTIENLKEHITIVRGKSYTSEEIDDNNGDHAFINLKNMKRNGGFRLDGTKFFSGKFKKEQIVRPGDIVMAVTDMTQDRLIVGRVARVPLTEHKEYVISLDIVKIVSTKLPIDFIYSTLRFNYYGEHIAQFANGTNVLHLNPELLRKESILIPDEDLIKSFVQTVKPMFELIDVLAIEIEHLRQIRDRLLPRLISGKLEVKESKK